MFKKLWTVLRKKYWLKKKLERQLKSLSEKSFIIDGDEIFKKTQEVQMLINRGNDDLNFWTGFLSALEWVKKYDTPKN